MSDTTTAPVEAPESVEVDTRVALSPTRSRIKVDAPADNAHFEADMVLYVTKNEKGSLRAIGAPAEAFELNQEFEAILGARKASLGTLTVVGTVVGEVKEGETGDKSLPFRLLG